MYVLLNEDTMEFLAKHPNFATLYELGVIACPDSTIVFSIEADSFKRFNKEELEALYINLTLKVSSDYSEEQLTTILIALLTEADETILNEREVSCQAQYAVDWGIEGYCSFQKGKREPSMDETIWDSIIVEREDQWETDVLAGIIKPVSKATVQSEFKGAGD